MSLNLFFWIIIAIAILCISISNKVIDTSHCTRHWIAILTICAGIAGLRGSIEVSFILIFLVLLAIGLFYIHRFIKQWNHVQMK